MLKRTGAMALLLCVVTGPSLAEAGDRADREPIKGARVVADKPYSRFCKTHDLIGTWHLVKFASQYEFKDPNAPYLLPHQMFQFNENGGMKSAHSPQAFTGDPAKVFKTIPAVIDYGFDRQGMVTMKAKGAADASETWHCVAVTEDKQDQEPQVSMKRGDLVMTLVGKNGQPLFVRQLRKGRA